MFNLNKIDLCLYLQEILISYCDEQHIQRSVQEDELTTKTRREKTKAQKRKKSIANFDLETLADLGFKTLQVMKEDAMLNEIHGLHLDLLINLNKLNLSCLIPSIKQVFKGKPVYASFEQCMRQFQSVTCDKDLVHSLTKQLRGSSADFVSWFLLYFMHVFAENYAREQITRA